jgi:hypothetical protein
MFGEDKNSRKKKYCSFLIECENVWVRKKIKKMEVEYSYCTPRTKKRKTVPVADFVIVTPSAQVTFTWMVVLPIPRIGESLKEVVAFGSSDGAVPLFVLPNSTRPPVKVMVH